MKDNLYLLVKRINSEVRQSGVNDLTLKTALMRFADAYRDIPPGDPAKVGEDSAAIEFLEDVLGKGNQAVTLYLDFYNALKKGEATIL